MSILPDTVAAITTGTGTGAVGVIEVCGPGALDAVAALFRPRRAGPSRAGAGGAGFSSGALVLGTLTDARDPLDEAMVCVRPAAESRTGETTVELHCHGGAVVLDAALQALERRGVRRVPAAELLDRAVRAGRLDRIQAEALARLADARTPLAARVLLDQSHGALARAVEALTAPERSAADIAGGLDDLLATARSGLAISDPPRVVLAGAANAGKSTLFNALLGADRALVHPAPGTTRDPVDALLAPGGMPLRLVDTAGLWTDPGARPGPVDAAGIAAAERAAEAADAVLLVVDATAPPPDAVGAFAARLREPRAWVFTKMDLLPAGLRESPDVPAPAAAFTVSGRDGRGVPELAAALPALAGVPAAPPPGAACVFTPRQRDALETARRALPDAALARKLLAGLRNPAVPDGG